MVSPCPGYGRGTESLGGERRGKMAEIVTIEGQEFKRRPVTPGEFAADTSTPWEKQSVSDSEVPIAWKQNSD
jgi:hypothetical protein